MRNIVTQLKIKYQGKIWKKSWNGKKCFGTDELNEEHQKKLDEINRILDVNGENAQIWLNNQGSTAHEKSCRALIAKYLDNKTYPMYAEYIKNKFPNLCKDVDIEQERTKAQAKVTGSL